MKNKPCCQSLLPWLRSNLGKLCLAPLTGTDARALAAAVHLIDLWSQSHDLGSEVLQAFGIVVCQMQPSTRGLAYHAIAHVMDWSDRETVWVAAGLAEIPRPRSKCMFEPGGSARPWPGRSEDLGSTEPAVADETLSAIQPMESQ